MTEPAPIESLREAIEAMHGGVASWFPTDAVRASIVAQNR